jgi:hypothetical protein
MLRNAESGIVGLGGAAQDAILTFLHPDNSGGNVSPPPTPTPSPSQNPPPSESQQGTVDTSPAAMAGGPKADDYPSRMAGGQAARLYDD